MIDKKIGIIGCGNMGEALLKGLSNVVEKSTSLMVSEMDTKRRSQLQSKYKMIIEIDNNLVCKYSDVIIIAVKPQDFENLLRTEICCGASEKKLYISIAAGITTKYIESVVGKEIPVIRAMPNMAAVIGEAITSLTPGSSAKKSHMDAAKEIFSTIGEVIEVDEPLVDAVTAISGSGPAYFFYLMEILIKAAKKLGFTDDEAVKLVIKTALGSAKLIDTLKEDPAVLRAKVTSKGGTTEAAFKVLKTKKMDRALIEAVKAARNRSKELSRG